MTEGSFQFIQEIAPCVDLLELDKPNQPNQPKKQRRRKHRQLNHLTHELIAEAAKQGDARFFAFIERQKAEEALDRFLPMLDNQNDL